MAIAIYFLYVEGLASVLDIININSKENIMLGHTDNYWEGFSWRKTYQDEQGVFFPDGNGKYEVSVYGKVIGYAVSETKAYELYVKHKGETSYGYNSRSR